MNIKILVLDDEKEIADLVTLYLENENYEVSTFYNASDALLAIDNEIFNLAVLDVMVPEVNGFTICQHIRKKHRYSIIMLTAKTEDIDKIQGLTLGADDYITKPFNPLELVARVKAQLRRSMKYNQDVTKLENGCYEVRDLFINEKMHTATLRGETLALTPIEFSILMELCRCKGSVVTSEALFERVWKEKFFDGNNTVMVHIKRLREKMKEQPRNPEYIKTVWGIGYQLLDE